MRYKEPELSTLLFSRSLGQAFLYVVQGDNYSASLCKKMRIGQPSAVDLLKRLKLAGLIEQFSDGAKVRYRPNMRGIERLKQRWKENAYDVKRGVSFDDIFSKKKRGD